MATCKECLHHGVCKDRDKLMLTVNDIFELMYQHGVERSCVHFKSTADVVPKGEVEATLKYCKDTVKTEVAREIFEEIEESLYYKMVNGEVTLMIRESDYHEIKNKYTEGAFE